MNSTDGVWPVNPGLGEAGPLSAPPWWLRAHQALMPDYNRKAAVYWWCIVVLGGVVLASALQNVAALSAEQLISMGAGIAVTLFAALFPVRIPRSKNSFAAGEIFIFLLLLLHGPAAATLAAAGEGLIGSWRTSKRWTSRIISPAAASIAMFATGSLFHAALAALREHAWLNSGVLLVATTVTALLYFVVNTVLITAVPHLKRDQWPRPRDMFGNFGWVGLVFAVSASVACLLFLSVQHSGVGVLLGAVPVVAMLLVGLHGLFRQQEADAAARQSRVDAAERETALAERHALDLEHSERRFHSAFTHASIGMALVSRDAVVLQVNTALRGLLGCTDEKVLIGRAFFDVVVEEHRVQLMEKLARLELEQASTVALEVRLHHRDGGEVWTVVHGSLFAQQEGVAPCLILQVQDVTARRHAEASLQHSAFHDSLTGLPNRRRFEEQLAQALSRAQCDSRRQFCLMFLDFDRFKLINDSLGHAVGDAFLVAAARRIQQQVRPHDIVARLGGDEFAIIAEALDSGRHAVSLADRLLGSLSQPMAVAATEIVSSASIGITFSSMGYATPQDMLRDADTAMYKAKAAGRSRYALFDAVLHTEVAQRLRLEGDLRRALSNGELSVVYQPMFDLTTHGIIGFEALARWNHPEFGVISPATFIPVAEDTGLIGTLTDWVLQRACAELGRWQPLGGAGARLTMHVNVSGSDIGHPGLVTRIKAALAEAQLRTGDLTLELTENILMERLEAALPTLLELREFGVGLSVDDFGTGYSSLQHLSNLPVNSLKVDRAFVAGLQQGSNDAAIVQAILLLGRSLGKTIIAEGIETQEQEALLRRMGCAAGQGYFLARPMLPGSIGDLLRSQVADVASRPRPEARDPQLH